MEAVNSAKDEERVMVCEEQNFFWDDMREVTGTERCGEDEYGNQEYRIL